ncbi:MAG: ABC transporter permease [Planctomycetota bacterium]|nr:ABC transporter permease [Planctomycetota bacterium]MDA1106547.1 ABC transporter permease [Planctomycetota bacterium]
MFPFLLAGRYLRSRLIPLIAVGAVALCVALVVIVVSVMTGFLDMLRNSGRSLLGDVIVSAPIGGIPYANEFMAELSTLPEVDASTPLVDTLGLLRMPYPQGSRKETVPVQVWGIDPTSFARVTDYADDLYWKPGTEEERGLMQEDDPRLPLDDSLLRQGETLLDGQGKPAIVLGMHVSIVNSRQGDGSYRNRYGWFLPGMEVVLTVVPIGESGRVGAQRDRVFTIANEIQTGIYEVDKNRVFVPIGVAQELLQMDAAPIVDASAEPDANGQFPVRGTSPARVSKILVRAKPGVTAAALRDLVEARLNAFTERISMDPGRQGRIPLNMNVLTWEQQLRDLIAPVEKEREMMRILFSIIYLVCAGLILSIFWAIVAEKTRDIGILRAVGASRWGILSTFLSYGLAIGVIGSLLGVALASVVVTRINDIHDAIGHDAPAWTWISAYAIAAAATWGVVCYARRAILLRTLLFGIVAMTAALLGIALLLHEGTLIWDPSVYYFVDIPSTVDWTTAVFTALGGVVFSVIGAAIPAAKAADTDPVEALRYG